MIIKEPNQAIYDELYKASLNLGYSTFNYLPDKTPYPFVYFGEQFGEPIETNSLNEAVGTSITTVHVWGDRTSRIKVSHMVEGLRLAAKKTYTANVYDVSYKSATPHFLQVKEDGVFLWHGILEIEMNYTFK